MPDFDEMLSYVHDTLEKNNALRSKRPEHFFRNRFDHTRRVLGWCKRIEDDLYCDKDILYTAAIFHDIGYAAGKDNHARASAELFIEYAEEHELPYEFTMNVADIVSRHSDKTKLGDERLSPELTLLMEADLLDEEGALGFVWDFMAIGTDPNATYYTSLDAINHSKHILNQDYMVTPRAKKYWDEKKKLVKDFCDSLEADLIFDEE